MPQPIFTAQELQQLTLFAGYIDPNLGYAFQSLGPILPAIIGAITGTIAMFWGQIKTLFHKIFSRKSTSETNPEKE